MTLEQEKKTVDQSRQQKPVFDLHTRLPLQQDSDKLLELIHYWVPRVSPWQPLKKTRNSSLRFACVVEDKLYQGIRFEGEAMLLTPFNWDKGLRYGKPDFLLMESIWNTATGHWHMGQCPAASGRDELLKIVSLARKLSIPTVFWFTKGHEYHEHYKNFAKHFEFVFCADPVEAELLTSEGTRAEVLLPCVQPAVYNPFRHYDRYDAFHLDILYDGWADLDRMASELSVLQEVKPYGLNIMESRYQILRRRLDLLPDYKENILGCVSEKSRNQALRYAKAYITLDKTLSTRTTQQWMTLEAAACRLPVVHHGSLADDDVRKEVVIECPDRMEIQVEFVRFQQDELYRERMAHLGWRKTFNEHSFAHRMQKICKTIGIEHDWEEYPRASLITPTFRRKILPRCFQTFEQQSYPKKELVLIFNGKDVPSHRELGLKKPRSDIKIANVSSDMFAGACLNQGHLLAEGEYCFRVDDDDYYGSNYILDMVLQARCIDADLFGKPMSLYYYLEENQCLQLKKTPSKPFMILTCDNIMNGLRFSGNSISGRLDFFKKNKYPDHAQSAADSIFIYNCRLDDKTIAIMDNLSMVAERRIDQSTHTWKVDPNIHKKNMTYVSDTFDCILR